MKALLAIIALSLASCAQFDPSTEQINAAGGLIQLLVEARSGK